MNEQNEYLNEQPHEELTRMVEPEAPKMGAIQRIVALFTAPGELMKNIKVYPVVWFPLIVVIALGIISIPLSLQTTDILNQELSNISIERYGVDLMNLGAAFDEYGDSNLGGLMDTFALVGAVAGVIFGPPIISFLAALGLWILSKIVKGSTTLGQMFSMCMHIYIIAAVGGLVVFGLVSITGNYLDMTSLAAVFMPRGNISMVSFNILSAISIFTVWDAILTYLGVKIINDISTVKAAVVTIIAFIVGVAIHVGIFMSTFIMWDMTMGMLG